MAKQFIIAAMEEVFGEYILNMSKENLKIAALKGKIKLENVQLDGELLGSHMLGALGLQGFGILSCSAQSIKISVPWGNLEKEPTKFEVRGIHLVCVPLMPSTANKMYGAGTTVDPRCRLRTRAKRLTLARFERNYWNGQTPNEGPPMKRIVRAVKEVETHLKRSRKRGSSKKGSVTSEEEEMSEAFDNLVLTLDNPDAASTYSDSEEKNSKDAPDLPELPRDWKVKLREKVFRNMEASMYDLHIRVEVSERGLDFSHEKSGASGSGHNAAEDRAFALGFTLDSLIVRTANDKWEIGSHDKRKDVDSSNMSSAKSHLGPNPYVVYNNKIGFFNKLSMYWDDEPPILLAETDVLQGNYRKLSPDKLQSRIAAAMEAMFHKQEPGKVVRKSLSAPVPSDIDEDRPHLYVCEGLDAEIRTRQSDRSERGPISCSGDVLPFTFDFYIRPHQYLQYQKLKTAMKSQQRFDTMLRQRPTESPMINPRAWWKYVIACVTSRPNWRPWEDVQRIVKHRQRYIELVMKKNVPTKEGRGYHAGLSVEDSSELLALEDLLPIEALLAFHLIALRMVYALQKDGDSPPEDKTGSGGEKSNRRSRTKSMGSGRFFLRRGNSNLSKRQSTKVDRVALLPSQVPGDEDTSAATSNSVTLLEAMTLRLGKKVWVVDWRFHDAAVNVTFLLPRDDSPLAHWVLRGRGSARSFGLGKRDFFFDITQFDVVHHQSKVLFLQSSEEGHLVEFDDYEVEQELNGNQPVSSPFFERGPAGPDLRTPSDFLEFPPPGVVCRLAGGKSMETLKLSISAHPATLVWTTSLFDGMSEFFAKPSTDLTLHVRNAATPLARKAQLALLSPVSMALHLNIAAPKVWVPIISVETEGALLLDAGMLKLSGVKGEGETHMDWDVNARDIKVNFVRGNSLVFRDDVQLRGLSHLGETSGRSETSVVRPVHVSVRAYNRVVEDGIDQSLHHPEVFNSGQFRSIDIAVSPVCLNLVDAEVLARAMGKWYASGIRRVRRRVTSTGSGTEWRKDEPNVDDDLRQSNQTEEMTFSPGSIPRLLSVTVEKLEMTLEGHSKILPTISDERSVASQDSLHDMTPHTRTYLVEVFRIEVRRSQHDQLSMTRFSVMDASIERLKDKGIYSHLKLRREAIESQDCILVRTSRQGSSTEEPETEIVRASLLHDGLAHLDEVEIDIDSVVLRVTPTTLKDCAKAFRRIAELVQLMTKEMERKVHEQGRKARQRGRRARDGDAGPSESPSSLGRPPSPTVSEVMTDVSAYERRTTKAPSDSSILFRVTLSESTLLAGRPTAVIQKSRFDRSPSTSFAVIQVLSNALVMFQSIENPDGTGIKTLHVSVDNASSLVNTEFERVSPSQAPPMIGPTGAEFRIVYATESLGCVVSQDISVDCEAVKSCLTPNDLSIMIKVWQKMVERLRAFSAQESGDTIGQATRRGSQKMQPWSSLIRYQKKGTGIATSIRMEIHAFSFVLLRAYKSRFGAPEFLDFNVRELKVKLEGCMSALSGECSAVFSVNFFNAEVSDWEYAVEPFPFSLGIDQMPNELVLSLSPACPIQLNLAGILLRDLVEMKFDILRDRSASDKTENDILAPSVLSTVGLRRATEAPSVHIRNLTGFDIQLASSSSGFEPGFGLVVDGATTTLDSLARTPGRVSFAGFPGHVSPDGLSLAMSVAPSALGEIGDREPVFDLPITPSASHSARVHVLRPAALAEPSQSGQPRVERDSRASPDTVFTEGTRSEFAYYHAEPVVEWCMHNQRLRSSTIDVFSLQKGSDILSSSGWSPEDDVNDDTYELSEYQGRMDPERDGHETASNLSPERKPKLPVSRPPHKTNWLRPYLKNDSPEWTDMTCTLRMARERVMLPDNNWVWVNDWTIDLYGTLGESTDSDGWEYQADFETFSKNRRYYERGDACRRRRWTRTRMVKPPRLDDPNRLLKFVWESSKDDNGNISVVVRSNVQIRNETGGPLTFFVISPSWLEHKKLGTAKPGETITVPVALASAVYLQLAKKVGVQEPVSIQDCVSSERIMILPTSFTSETIIRASMSLQDVSGTTLHFLVKIVSDKGIVDVVVLPVLRVVNLLPCQLQCQLGEVALPSRPVVGKLTKKFANAETLQISSGKVGNSTALNPWSKPHISLRVPGYKWSAWQRIVNRKANSNTWRSPEAEEDWQFSSKGDADFADEFKTIIRFERTGHVGDPLTLVISVECGHCPTLRVYSQYWIIDKTGFGCRFCDGFNDLMNSVPETETSRRSHLLYEEAKDPAIRNDMNIPGHQWSIGMSGMSLYYSKREKLALSIETGIGDERKKKKQTVRSKWVSPLDISNVVPKTVFSVDELGGPRRFELAISVTVCPGIFARTKLITLLPRYQIVNLLHRELVVAQDSCLDAETVIPSQSAVPFHWEKGSLAPKVRLGAPSVEERDRGIFEKCWTNGRFRLDRVGITSMRLPTDNTLAQTPMVVQAEVRLATKDQSSAVVVVIWSANEKSNPLYVVRNSTPHTILCRQPLQDEQGGSSETGDGLLQIEGCSGSAASDQGFECATEVGPMVRSFLGLDRIEEFVWVLKSGDVACFGFDDPEKPHIIEWTCVSNSVAHFDERGKKAFLEVDAMGSSSILNLVGGGQVRCQIGAEHSTKVIEFVESRGSLRQRSVKTLTPLRKRGLEVQEMLESEGFVVEYDHEAVDDEDVAFSFRVDMPALSISVVDNADPEVHGREILLAQFEKIFFAFSQTREGYHELEMRLMTFQVDNHVQKSIHPVLIFCPRFDEQEPLLHMSAVRRLQNHSNTYVFRYAAIRLLDIEIFLDRRTAETVARFIAPLSAFDEAENEEPPDWVFNLTAGMARKFATPDRRAPRDIEKMIHTANSGRIYFEQLHLHPVRLSLTFTQEWMEWYPGSEEMMVFQFIRGMASIANAPLTFTSFVVGHVFEAPQALLRVIATHYSSQLTKQIFGLLGSLAILGAPADFISNVGTGVRDFFYEPIQGAVQGPRQFIEGLEAGTQSLARGVFVGVVRGAANVTEAVNANLAGLTADDEFIDERKAHQRLLTDAMSRGSLNRTFGDSLVLAGGSVVRGIKSGAFGIVEQPAIYASKYGPVGFVKGVGKAVLGAIVKPVVGLGDAAVLVMNHMSDATCKKLVLPKIPKRLRRALPSRSTGNPNCVRLEPYDERAAKAQKIVTGGESVEDVYIGHIDIPSHLIIASEQSLWAIDRRSREPWCVSWEEISHFGILEGGVRVVVFSQTGLKTYVFQVENASESVDLHKLLSMQLRKMGNSSELNSSILNAEPASLSRDQIPGIQARQVNHVFGSCNRSRARLSSSVNDEIDIVEQCFARVKDMESDSSTFLKTLDEEAWSLVSSWGHVFSGLSSRRCIVTSIINGTGLPIQIKSTKLVEGGSPCYSIPTKEFDAEQGILNAGGVIIFFGWGVVPNLLQPGYVFMHVETNGFICDLSGHKNRSTVAEAMPGYQVGFLEKSYDDSGWWAKYWMLVRKK